LNHGDFHDNNIFFQDGRFLIFDWGDCTVSHPFYSLRTTFVSLYWSLNLDEGSPELDRLRDIYLEPWSTFEPTERLLEAFKLSQRLAAVNGALVWHRILSRTEGPAGEEFVGYIPSLLREFLESGDR
jgi:aminoglycoside phosphotransferase (APT) family kinase protein